MNATSISRGLYAAISHYHPLYQCDKSNSSSHYITGKELHHNRKRYSSYTITKLPLAKVIAMISLRFKSLKGSTNSTMASKAFIYYAMPLEQYGRDDLGRRTLYDHICWIFRHPITWLKGGSIEGMLAKALNEPVIQSKEDISNEILGLINTHNKTNKTDNINTKFINQFVIKNHPDRLDENTTRLKQKKSLFNKILRKRTDRNKLKAALYTVETHKKSLNVSFRHFDFSVKLLLGGSLLIPSLLLLKRVKAHLIGFSAVAFLSYLTTYHRPSPAYKTFALKPKEKKEPTAKAQQLNKTTLNTSHID